MKLRMIVSIVVVLSVMAMARVGVAAHHSNVAFAVETVLEAKGVVKEWQWTNPHTWLIMVVDDGKGGKTEWAMEGRAPGVLLRAGWSAKVLKPGDQIVLGVSSTDPLTFTLVPLTPNPST